MNKEKEVFNPYDVRERRKREVGNDFLPVNFGIVLKLKASDIGKVLDFCTQNDFYVIHYKVSTDKLYICPYEKDRDVKRSNQETGEKP